MIESFLNLNFNVQIAIGIAIICIILILRIFFSRIVNRIFKIDADHQEKELYRKKLINNLTLIMVLSLLVYATINSPWYDTHAWLSFVVKILLFFVILNAYYVGKQILKLLEQLYLQLEISKKQSIKPIIQVGQIALAIVAFLIIIGLFTETNPISLIASATALTAVLGLIFKDTILAFFAGTYLSGSKMIQLGDWIEVPSLNASGSVSDIGMTHITLRNLDNSTTTLPSYQVISNEITNYSSITKEDGRYINKTLAIDPTKIKTINPSKVESLIKKYDLDENSLINTNADLLVATITNYIKRHHSVKTESVRISLGNQSMVGFELLVKAATKISNLNEFETFQTRLVSMIIFYINHFDLHLDQKWYNDTQKEIL